MRSMFVGNWMEVGRMCWEKEDGKVTILKRSMRSMLVGMEWKIVRLPFRREA
jgi:hypothetical protein